MNDSNISTYPAMSDGDNSQKGAAMTVSGGTFKTVSYTHLTLPTSDLG